MTFSQGPASFIRGRSHVVNPTLFARVPYDPIKHAGRGSNIGDGGASLDVLSRRAAYYVDKIFKGAKPADLPVQQPTEFEMVISFTTAKVLGLPIPPTLIARADEVIEQSCRCLLSGHASRVGRSSWVAVKK
jgi:ABC transporter substrate binding protein